MINTKYTKLLFAMLWAIVIFSSLSILWLQDITLSQFHSLIIISLKDYIISMGITGGIIFILAHLIRPLIFFPATILTALGGLLFGPYLGFIYTLIGENLSALIAFLIARYFRGSEIISKKQKIWVAKINKQVKENGFMTTLILRLLWAPFDLVNYGLGLTHIKTKDFFLATVIGSIPAMTILILLGNLIGQGSQLSKQAIVLNLALSAIILIVSLIITQKLKAHNKKLAALKQEAERLEN